MEADEEALQCNISNHKEELRKAAALTRKHLLQDARDKLAVQRMKEELYCGH